MMDQFPEIYNLETIEQIRALADGLRTRICDALAGEAMTAKQLAVLLGEPPARTHYHVRELERVGLVKLVETRAKGGILEKYYRAVARGFSVPDALLGGMPHDEGAAEMNRMLRMVLRTVTDGFRKALAARGTPRPGGSCSMNIGSLWLSKEEYGEVQKQLDAVLDPYRGMRQPADEPEPVRQEYTFALLTYGNVPSTAAEESVSADEHSTADAHRPREQLEEVATDRM